MSETIAYGNRRQMIRFDIRVTESLVDDLVRDGYLDDDEFDWEEYERTLDWDDEYRESAKALTDAIIVWFEDKAEEELEKCEDASCKDEWTEAFEDATDLSRIVMVSTTGDNFYDLRNFGDVPLVEIRDVDPDDPYRS